MSHYLAYLYGHRVTVYIDHSAECAVLQTLNPSRKHARWRSLGFDSGVKSVDIVYRSGKYNSNADALSRSCLGVAAPRDPTVEEFWPGGLC